MKFILTIVLLVVVAVNAAPYQNGYTKTEAPTAAQGSAAAAPAPGGAVAGAAVGGGIAAMPGTVTAGLGGPGFGFGFAPGLFGLGGLGGIGGIGGGLGGLGALGILPGYLR